MTTSTKTKIRGVDGYQFNMTRSATVPGAFNVVLTKTYRPESDEFGEEEIIKKTNISFGEVIGFLEDSLVQSYF